MNRINRVAVLGAGVMGATIAAQLANAGLSVLLLDIATPAAAAGRDGLLKMKPSPLYLPEYASSIEIGSFDDDIARLKECDWVIEVVIENMGIKKKLLAEKIAPNLKVGAILSTNTSGLSVNELAEALPAGLRSNFLVTHFFNPPRYMRLMEIVPCRYSDPQLVAFMTGFIARRLGKGIVTAKDTPNFIANRIGIYAICNSIRTMLALGMTVEEVDAVAGRASARPKSASFRTADLVGIDTLKHVADNSHALLTGDEEREIFLLPPFVDAMLEKGLLGNKSRQGFFKKVKGEQRDEYFYYDFPSGDYLPAERPKYPSVEAALAIDDPARRLNALLRGSDKGAEFAWINLRDTLIYSFNRITEVADDVINVDNAMKWGFNWELGPFEMFDAIGVAAFIARAERDGVTLPKGLYGIDSFYKTENGADCHFFIPEGRYLEIPSDPERITLTGCRKSGGVVEHNSGASVIDLGDGVFCLEFHSKMNAIGGEILAMTHKALKRAEEQGAALVISNEGGIFSAGANLMLLAVAVAEGAYDEIAMTVKGFQKAMMAVKYSRVPVVAAPHNLAVGGGCEICLHSDAITAHAETYMGLVELGVGLLPAGGGTKEMALRAIRLADEYDVDPARFIFRNYMNIAVAKVSSSADELFRMGLMRQGDSVTMDRGRLLHDAKQKALALAANYRPQRPLTDLKAPGRSVAATIKSQLWNMQTGGFISGYDRHLAGVVADVITGGDVPAGTLITEEYLLELEREAFVRLCGEKKTVERVQYMLKKGKPLRN